MATFNETVDTAGASIVSNTDLNYSIEEANAGNTVVGTFDPVGTTITEAGGVIPIDLAPNGGALTLDGTGGELDGQATGVSPTLTLRSGDLVVEALTIGAGAAGTVAINFSPSGATPGLTDAEVEFEAETGGALLADSAVTGVIQGVGSVLVDQGAVVELSAADTYTGKTIVGGELDLTGAGSISASHNVSLGTTGALDISGITTSTSINELTGLAGSSVALGDKGLTVNENVVSAAFSGTISGSALSHLALDGPDALTLKGDDSAFAGHLIINTDVALSGATASISGAHNVTLGAAGELDISGLTGGGTPATIHELTGAAGSVVALGANSLTVDEDVSTPGIAGFSGVFTGSASSQLTLDGPDALNLMGANTGFLGHLSIDTDVALVGATASISAAHNVTLGAAGELDISGLTATSGTPSTTIHELTGLAGSVVALGANNLTVDEDVVSAEYDGVFTGSSASHLTLNGPDTLNLRGNSSAFAGHIAINTDVTLLGATASISGAHNVTLGAAGELDISGLTTIIGTPSTTIHELTGVAGGTVVLGDNDLTVDEDVVAATFAGVFTGSASSALTLNGPDALTLTGNSTGFTGALDIDTDVILTGVGSVLAADSVTLGAAGTLDVSGVSASAVSVNELSGAAGSTINIGAVDLTVNENTANGTFAGVITGSGHLTIDGPDALTLSGNNAGFTGHLTIDTSVLLSGAGSIAAAHNVTLGASGSLDLSGVSSAASINELTGVAGSVVTLGASSLTINEDVQSATFGGAFAGTSGSHLTLDGPDALTLTGDSSAFAGHLSIDTDVILTGAASIAGAHNVSLQSSAGVLDVSGVTASSVNVNELTGVAGSSVVLGAKTLVINENAAPANFGGVISGSGAVTFGGGLGDTLTLLAAQTYAGVTTVNSGTLALGANGSIASASTVGVVINGGALSVAGAQSSGGGNVNESLASLTGTGGTLALGTNSLTITGANTGAFAGSITGGTNGSATDGSVTVAAGADLSLSGSSSYTGKTVVDGSLTLTGIGPANVISQSHNVTLGATGELTVDIAPLVFSIGGIPIINIPGSTTINELTGAAGSVVNLQAGTLIVDENVVDASFSGVISGSGNFSLEGADSLTLASAETYTGVTTVLNGADLVIGANGSITSSSQVVVDGTLDLSGAAATNTLNDLTGNGSVVLGANNLVALGTGEFDGVISGSGNLQIGGGAGPAFASANLTLGGDNTYTGKTVVYGTLTISSSSNDGGTLADSHNVSLAGSHAALIVDTDESINELTGVAGSKVTLNNGSTLSITENVINGTFSGAIGSDSNYNSIDILANGNGPTYTLKLNGAGTYTGDTIIEDGATLALGAQGSLGGTYANSSNYNNNINSASSTYVFGTLDVSAVTTGPAVITDLTDDNNVSSGPNSDESIVLGANTLEDVVYNESEFGGTISGSGGLTLVSGNGNFFNALALYGDNTYTGATTIQGYSGNGSGPTLVVDGSLATSNIVVSGNGVLDLEIGGAFDTAVTGAGNIEIGYYDFNGGETVSVTTAFENFSGDIQVGAGFFGQDAYTLALGATDAIANAADVYIDYNATLDISAAGGTVQVKDLNIYSGANLALGANTLELTGGQADTNGVGSYFGGTLAGTGGLQIDASAHASFSGGTGSSYTGSTVIFGELDVESGNQISDSQNVSLMAGGILHIDTATTLNQLSGEANSVINLTATLTVEENVAAASVSSVIAGSGGFTLDGPDTLTLHGANTYTGATTIDTGATLAIGTGGSIAASTNVVVDGTLDLTSAGSTVALTDLSGTGSITLGATAASLTENGADTFSGGISGTGSITVHGSTSANSSTALALTGDSTFSGGLTIASGTVELGAADSAGTGTITFHDAAGNGAGVLQLDALTAGPGNTQTLANTITGLSETTNATGGDIIDLTSVGFVQGATATYNATTDILTVSSGAATVNLHVTGVPAGDVFEAFADNNGHTFVEMFASATNASQYEASHYHP